MPHALIELSRTKTDVGGSVVIEDYGQNPMLCRSGVWVGWKEIFTETVVMTFEHGTEDLYVGWELNGVTVIDPGYSPGTPPQGDLVPGAPSIVYRTPVNGFYHELSLTNTAGTDETCVHVRVLYRGPTEATAPAHLGPATSVCLNGTDILWPADKVAAEQICLAKYRHRIDQYVIPAYVGPGDPVELGLGHRGPADPLDHWLAGIRGEDAIRVAAEVEALEKAHPEADHRLNDAIRRDLAAKIGRARMRGAAKRRIAG
jgi:hypothetical protein